MDWRLLGISFITVFLAELGDKSQLAAIALSGNAKSPKAVFLGSIAALILASFIGVIIGEGTAQVLPAKWTKLIAAIGFAVMAVRLLFFGSDEEEESPPAPSAGETEP
jgi:putative Ca2+/H+ antiporter (TMEM165/GDT1 family)